MIHLFLATGFEEIEALATLDVLRRCNLEVSTVSITGTRLIHGAHGIPIMADTLLGKSEIDNSECLILPGGMPGARNLCACDSLRRALQQHNKKGTLIAAICAAPMVLGELGILQGKNATCYPGFEEYLKGAVCVKDLAVKDGNIITAKGPGATWDFAFKIAEHFVPVQRIKQLKSDLLLKE